MRWEEEGDEGVGWMRQKTEVVGNEIWEEGGDRVLTCAQKIKVQELIIDSVRFLNYTAVPSGYGGHDSQGGTAIEALGKSCFLSYQIG